VQSRIAFKQGTYFPKRSENARALRKSGSPPDEIIMSPSFHTQRFGMRHGAQGPSVYRKCLDLFTLLMRKTGAFPWRLVSTDQT